MPKLTSHPSREELSAYSLGQLPEERAVAIDTHISQCEPCCETIVELSSEDAFAALLQEAGRLPTDLTVERDSLTAKSSAASEEIPAPLAEHPRYEIVRLIGKGGMGDVYEARHRMMERTVALKVIKQELMRKSEAVDRFHREVKAAAQLAHPNVVTAYDAEQAGDIHFMVMEFVDGVDLSQMVKQQGALPIADACAFIRQAAIGLQHAHERGMVHRDIKPHNLMVTADGTIKILDFGLASLAPEAVSSYDSDAARSDLTAVGEIMGTPDFISPEQANDARQVDIRSDIYSLGATLYFLLSGRVPFDDGSVMHKLASHAQVEPDSLATLRDDVPEQLVAIVSKMMAKDASERYLTPSEVANALESFLQTWQPTEATSQEQEPSCGGSGASSGGEKGVAGDMSPEWLSVIASWLFYLSLVPIVVFVLDEFFLSDATSVADRGMYYLLASVVLSTIGGALSGVRAIQSETNGRSDHGVIKWKTSEMLILGFVLGAAAVLYYIETDIGVVRIDVTDPSIRVSVQDQIVTMKDGEGKSLTINPGDQMLLIRVEDADFEFHTDLFQIRRGDEVAFKVEVLKDEIVILKDGRPFDRQKIIDLSPEP